MIALVTFMNPERLWWLLLLPAILGLYLILGAMRSSSARRRNASPLEKVLPRQGRWKRHLAVLLAVLSLGAMVVAYSRPSGLTKVPRERATVVLVLDVSKSMKATDVSPTRLKAAQDAAKEFLGEIPPGFNVSLVQFAGTSQLLVPPTADRGAVTRVIDGLQLAPSTAIGEGIYSGLDSLALVPPDPKDPDAPVPAVMVLLSDGGTNVGRSSEKAAGKAKDMDCPIYTIAYGTTNGYIEEDGQRQPVPVRYSELRTIAQVSGGKAYEARSGDELNKVYDDIASSVGYEEVETEITRQFIGWGLLCAVLASLGVISIAARWP